MLLVALGGALGAVARYGVTLLGLRWTDRVPAGTWIANLAGCVLIGLLVPLLARPDDGRRALVLVGFLGAFTTFSTYTLETAALWEAGRPGLAALNALGSVAAGLALVALGLWAGRALAAG